MDERTETNRANWEDRAAVHPDTDYYDVAGFLDGESTLRAVERRELADVVDADTRLCHLMCHFGLDTLSWARRCARVTGVDFSETAVETARDIADEAGLADHATFVCADVLDACDAVADEFDIVFASYGVLVWVEDLAAFAETAADLLEPGGTFYLVDGHPLSHTLDDEGTVAHSYFRDEPVVVDQQGTYADPDAELDNTKSYQWTHALGDVVTAVADAGLRVEFCHEFPFAHFEKYDGMVEDDGRWRPAEGPALPLSFSLRATRE